MGCFMACFGLSNKRKRRKTLYKVLAGHQKYGNYEILAITEKSIIPYSDFRGRDEPKEQNGVKSKKKKKVTFNLNVEVYEPNPTAYQVLKYEEEENMDNTADAEGSAALTMRYPLNHRYYNCKDGYDEEDEIAYEESDMDGYDDDNEFDDGYDWDSDESLENDEDKVYDENTKQRVLTESCFPSVAEDRIKNQKPLAPNDAEVKSNLSGRDRGLDMHSVLSPVENLTQWKAIKAKVISNKHRRKENVPSEQNTSMHFSPCSLESNALQSKPLLPEMAVDASLSNWLVSPSYSVSTTTIHCQ
ncbi:uncharacterized protein LOC113871718 [Abrus precatorius]|uniref:Uncharacterized protein LOC113871718 n=1 Tax=Abrus precatorius TaxID=3816 RepID=A0A8B8M9Y1_ABRPR|nr:uncharacterized protein LOC113871718 [Abrus precatorius]